VSAPTLEAHPGCVACFTKATRGHSPQVLVLATHRTVHAVLNVVK
jgi:hypothetical protein